LIFSASSIPPITRRRAETLQSQHRAQPMLDTPVVLIRPAEPVRGKISECIALMPADSTATIDPDFAKDVEAAIAAHREPLETPAWD
jgi:hypothetical protein